MSVQAQIDRLNAIKARMRTNLVAQGVTVPDDTTLETMATMVLSVAGDDANVTSENIISALGYTPANAQTVSQLSADIAEIGTQEEIVQQVIAALGTPVFGTVDANNHIVLSGHLVDGTYTISFEDTDGFVAEVCTIEKGEVMPDSGEVELVWADGIKLDKNTGAEGSGDGYSASQLVDVVDGYTYTIHHEKASTNQYSGITVCYYGEGNAYLGYTELWSAENHTSGKSAEVVMKPGTKAIRVRAYFGANYAAKSYIVLDFTKNQ